MLIFLTTQGGTGFSNKQKGRHLVGLSNDLSVVTAACSGVLRTLGHINTSLRVSDCLIIQRHANQMAQIRQQLVALNFFLPVSLLIPAPRDPSQIRQQET